jgi:exodeoxyribonuclease-3
VALTIATINVNGIRAALRNGMTAWLADRQPDIVTLQEVRAPDALVHELLGPDWAVAHAECSAKGRAGVAVIARRPLERTAGCEHEPRFADAGRWVEADVRLDDGDLLTVISVYAHTGDAESPERMEEKLAFFESMTSRMEALRADGRHVLLTGDLNVAHREVDIKNWKGNLKSAGFLPVERAYFDRWFDELGWVDLGRHLGGDGPGPYTWWSFRGKAFDTDAGWRIDYQIATPELAAVAKEAVVDRAPDYHARWSDHAPLVVTYLI